VIGLRSDRDQRRQVRIRLFRLLLSEELVQVDPLALRLPSHQLDRRAAERDHLLSDAQSFQKKSVCLRDPFRRDDCVGHGVFLE